MMRRLLPRAALAVLCFGIGLALDAVTSAQTINNPSTIEFLPSPDHNTPTGNAGELTSYVVTVIGPASKTVDIGKPAVVAGKITYTGFATAYAGLPACPTVAGALTACYTATVAARGPGGTSAATPSSTSFSSGVPPPPAAPAPVPGAPIVR